MLSTLLVIGGVFVGLIVLLAVIVSLSARPSAKRGSTSASRTPTWEAAFATLDLAGLPVSLVGRTLRVPGADPATVGRLLSEAGVDAEVASVPASFEETFVTLAS